MVKSAKKKIKKNEFGVLLEHLDSRFEQVLEGYVALDIKFDKKFNELKEGISILTVGQRGLTERVDGLTERVDDLTIKVDDLTKSSKQILEYLGHIDDEIKDLKDGLNQKADLKYVQRLEIRLVDVELTVQKHYD